MTCFDAHPREVSENYYDNDRVENGAADGAYSKNQNTCCYYKKCLNVNDSSEWIQLQWDYAHCIDLAEGDAREGDVPCIEKHLDLAQEVTKQFRYGKEFSHICVNNFGCVSDNDTHEYVKNHADDIQEEKNCSEVSSTTLMPVIRSNLKFAAHGEHFLNNYSKNLPSYVIRMNEVVNDENENEKKRQLFKGLLSKINVTHVTVIYGLLDIYSYLAKAQHGVSKVNQFPWNYSDRVSHLKFLLDKIGSKDFDKCVLKERKSQLEQCQFPDGSSIRTEYPRQTRSEDFYFDVTNEIDKGENLISKFARSISVHLSQRIETSEVITLMKEAFHDWNDTALDNLVSIANSSGRHYGSSETLLCQFKELKKRFSSLPAKPKNIEVEVKMSYKEALEEEIHKWLCIYHESKHFSGIEEILHFSLCCFVKAPLEATAETIGSLINQHGRKGRYSLLPTSLSNEVHIA